MRCEAQKVSVAGWSSLVARQAHNLKVEGSNPSPATNFKILDKLQNVMTENRILITKVTIFLFMFLICINLTKEHWQNFYNYNSEKNFYQQFSEYINYEIYQYESGDYNWSRTYEEQPGSELEQREKTRWVFLQFITYIMILIDNASDNISTLSEEKVTLFLYSIFIGLFLFLTFTFVYVCLKNLIILQDKTFTEKNSLNLLIYCSAAYLILIFLIFFVHFRGGEDNFSIFETFFISLALFCIAKNENKYFILYIIICLIAPLIRESGLFISGFYWLFNLLKNKKIFHWSICLPFFSLVPYIVSNYDLFKFFLEDGFIYSTKSMDAQTTWHDLFSVHFLGTLNAIFYNFLIFFLPIFVFFRKNNTLQIYFLLLILLYFLALSLGSVLDHISTRFMPGILIIIYSYVGIKEITFEKIKSQ